MKESVQDPVVINVLGAGRWGPNLIRSLHFGVRSRVGKICDVDPEKLNDLPIRYRGTRITSNPDEAIHDPEAQAIAIVTPVATHFEMARKALLAGKHVLIEKPMASSTQQCEELIAIAEKAELVLMVGHTFRFNPSVRFVKKLLDQGEIGKILSLHAIRANLGTIRPDVNVLWDVGTHDLSIFNYWLGSQPNEVTAAGGRNILSNIEDTVSASYFYPGPVLATLLVSWLHPRKVREITIVGQDKMIVWNDMDLNEPVRIYDKGVRLQEKYIDTFGAFRLALREGNVQIPPVHGQEPLVMECEHFVECIVNRKTPDTDGRDGLNVVRALEAGDESMRRNSIRVSIP